MSDYGNVALALYKKDYRKLVRAAKNSSDPSLLKFITKNCKILIPNLGHNDYVVLYWRHTLWSSDDKPVLFVMNFLYDVNTDVSYKFIFDGEEDNNCTHESYCSDNDTELYNLISPHHDIHFNFKFKEE